VEDNSNNKNPEASELHESTANTQNDSQKKTELPDIWKVFYERVQNNYEVESKIASHLVEIMQKIWKDTSPVYNQPNSAEINIGENGKVNGSMSAWVLLVAIAALLRQIMEELNTTSTAKKDLKRFQKKVLSQIESMVTDNMAKMIPIEPIRCPHCGNDNNKFAIYCNTCGKKIA